MINRLSTVFFVNLILLDVFVKTDPTIRSTSPGLVSSERYLVDEISSLHKDLSSPVRELVIKDLNAKLLKFEPEFLDFRQRPLGIPHLEKVTLINGDSNRSIDMTSISGSTVHFHSSFFEDKRIPPLGNTSFNVIFLGREEGPIESNLFVHTTEGHLKFRVRGSSTASPYRLRPIVGIKLPLNTTFSPLIYVYNPHAEAIQIMEIYSSGGDFHLELPSGELEGPKNLWVIKSMETKAVIRVRFHAQTEQNHTAYVRIKLNNTEDILVVPLEVEVTPTAGLYVSRGFIDFGVGGTLDAQQQVDLLVHNPLKRAVKIRSISSDSKAIKIDYDSVKVSPDGTLKNGKEPVKIATLRLNWKAAFENKDLAGKIIIKYKNKESHTEIPYYLNVYFGGLMFNSTTTSYLVNEAPKHLVSRNVVVKNKFLQPLALINVSCPLDASNHFNILNFKSVILKPDEEYVLFTLTSKTNPRASNVKLNSFILLETNISTVRLPLLSYNGKLKLKFPYKSKDNSLDLGLLGVDAKKDTHFLVINKNPVPINFLKITASLPTGNAQVIGCSKGNHSTALLNDLYKNMTKCVILDSNEFAIIRLTVRTPRSEGQVWGDVTIETQYERLTVPVHFKVAVGKLDIGPDRLVFDRCFPGKICSHPLKIHSTFNEPMMIENIVSIPPDPRLSTRHLSHIMARSTKIVGHLYLDPQITCRNECYSSLNANDRERWLQTLTLPLSTPELDLSLANMFYNRYLNETWNGLKRWQNLTMRLDTSKVKLRIFKTRVKMSWPSLVVIGHSNNGSVVKFPLTQVGTPSFRNITISNPSSYNLVVQLVLHHSYRGFENLNEGLPPNFIPGYSNYEFLSREGVFFFNEDLKLENDLFHKRTYMDVHESSLSVVLGPSENYTFCMGFEANDEILNSAFLYIRNNLTVVEVLQLNGQGALPNFKFGNRKPGSTQPLAFELTERHLRDCENEFCSSPPSLTVKRTFTARNMGELPILINGFNINGMPCEGYGFKVLNCDPFLLLPNSTRKIDIAFTPDFTSSKVVRTLGLETTLNFPVNYTLMSTIPAAYLSACSQAITRPAWEPYLYYVTFFICVFYFLFINMTAFVDAQQILHGAIMLIKKESSTTRPIFDLGVVGKDVTEEFRSPKHEEVVKNNTVEEKSNVKEIVDLMDAPDKPKPEVEKYTALIPTVGKSKKKLLRKNELVEEVHKKTETKNRHKSEFEHSKKVDHSKEHKKLKKLHLKTDIVPEDSVQEEIMPISPTTESDEVEKESKVYGKKSPVSKFRLSPPVKLQIVMANKENFPKHEHGKKARKFVPKRDKELHDIKLENKQAPEYKSKGKTHVKEKQSLGKRTSLERKLSDNRSNSANRISPTIQCNSAWSENRAKFSDVVARTETTPTNVAPSRTCLNQPHQPHPHKPHPHQSHPQQSHPQQPHSQQPLPPQPHSQQPHQHQPHQQASKPFMLVEPYKQTPTDLGPIGSTRKIEYHPENRNLNTIRDQQVNQLSNSFFSDSHNVMSDGANGFSNYGNSWDCNLPPRNGTVHSNSGYDNIPTVDSWGQHNSNTGGVWNSQNVHNETYPTPQINEESRYLWGTSTVWQPPIPSPRTPTRTPPGFTREIEERFQQQNQSYDLFGLTNMWARQYPNPWTPPQDQ